MKSISIWVVLALACSGLAWAHPGGTNGDGCHVDPNGAYHCH